MLLLACKVLNSPFHSFLLGVVADNSRLKCEEIDSEKQSLSEQSRLGELNICHVCVSEVL